MRGTQPHTSKLTLMDIYTSYDLDVVESGKARTEKGKATEVFVRRGGGWLNTGWQLAPETGRAAAGAPGSRP